MLGACYKNVEGAQWMVVAVIIITVFLLEFLYRRGLEAPLGPERFSISCECDHLESLKNTDAQVGPTPRGSDFIGLGVA